jgi:hypothetical protein
VFVAVNDSACTEKLILDKLQATLRVTPEVAITTEETVMRWRSAGNSRKIVRFIDDRKGI